MRRTSATSRLGIAAIGCVLVAYAVMAQGPGWNQNAHYALVRSLARGTATIDQTRFETGRWYSTGDVSLYRGHYYAAKAPGLALVSLPAYLPFKAAGVWNSGDDTRMLWLLTLFGVVLPAAFLLFTVRHVADRLQPGAGTATALVLGVATLVMPFSTLYFAHLLSATLGFLAFAVLWHEREGPSRLGLLGVAGLLAGLGVTTEYPLAIVVLLLGLYAVTRRPYVKRGLAYAAGAAVGVVPLALYQWWAFGSPTRFAYGGDVYGGLNRRGTFGVEAPSFHTAVKLLFSDVGLLRLSPVLALAAVGVVLLYRRGRRAEAAVLTAVPIAFLVYNAGYETPFGGSSPGPRFLIAALPFAALALAPVFSIRPVTTLLLAAPSAVVMFAVTVTHPLENRPGHAQWFGRFGDQDFSATVLGFAHRLPLDELSLPSSTHWYPLVFLLAPLALAVGLAAAERPDVPVSLQDTLTGAACLLGWLAVYRQGPRLLDKHLGSLLVLLLVCAVAAVAFALPLVLRRAGGSLAEGRSSKA